MFFLLVLPLAPLAPARINAPSNLEEGRDFPARLQHGHSLNRGYSSQSSLDSGVMGSQEISARPSTGTSNEVRDGPAQPVPSELHHSLDPFWEGFIVQPVPVEERRLQEIHSSADPRCRVSLEDEQPPPGVRKGLSNKYKEVEQQVILPAPTGSLTRNPKKKASFGCCILA